MENLSPEALCLVMIVTVGLIATLFLWGASGGNNNPEEKPIKGKR